MLAERWQTLADQNRTAAPQAALLTGLATLRFEGSDALTFLQGYLTCDTERLTDGEAHLTALTNLKGRVVANGWCRASSEETVDWLIHESLAEPVVDFMARYLAFSRSKLHILTADHLEVGRIDVDGETGSAVSAVAITDEHSLETLLLGHRVVGEAAWHAARISRRIALITRDTTGLFLPQMIGLVEAGAVDFDKGCYLGQEVVARAQHRGEVKRRLALLEGPGADLPPGTPVQTSDGAEAGSIIDTAPPHCLAVLRTPNDTGYSARSARLETVQP